MKRTQAQVVSNTQIMPGIYLLWVAAPEIASSAKAGQFAMLRCGEGNDPLLRRPLSVHRIRKAEIAFLFSMVGHGTELLAQRGEEDIIDLLGPLGKGFSINRASSNLLLVAGGIGIAPLVALAEEALAQGRSVTLLLGAETASQIYPAHLLPPEVELAVTTVDGSMGRKGVVTDLLPDFVDWADQIFACGPLPMYLTLADQSYRLPPQKSIQVLLEVMMACGLGACYSCAIETRRGMKLVCRDGPRFNLREVLWEKVAMPPQRLAFR